MTTELLKLSRNQLWQTSGLITGHCYLKGHLFKLGLVNGPTCERCHNKEETASHIVFEYEAVAKARFGHLGAYLRPRNYSGIQTTWWVHFAGSAGMDEDWVDRGAQKYDLMFVMHWPIKVSTPSWINRGVLRVAGCTPTPITGARVESNNPVKDMVRWLHSNVMPCLAYVDGGETMSLKCGHNGTRWNMSMDSHGGMMQRRKTEELFPMVPHSVGGWGLYELLPSSSVDSKPPHLS
jgi:hypothetical protein